MKYFLLLTLFSFSALADIDCLNRKTGESKPCDVDQRCIESAAEAAIATPERALNQAMNCPNILRIADYVAGEDADFDPAIDRSERGNSKSELPDIDSSEEYTSSKTTAQ